MEKELAASEDVGELRLELGKDEDKLFAEVSDVFGQDDSVDNSLHLDEDPHSHEENSPVKDVVEDNTEVVILPLACSNYVINRMLLTRDQERMKMMIKLRVRVHHGT